MDTDEYERRNGTVELGRANFDTKNSIVTMLDAPGHKDFVPNMIRGVYEADIGVLVISAREPEFETGFQEGGKVEMIGQTREHVLIAKGLGLEKVIVVVNKMDDPTVNWSEDRYNEIQEKVVPFLQSVGYDTNEDVVFLPISGLIGINMDKRMEDVCSWWSGRTLFEVLDSLEVVPPGDPLGPFRMSIFEHYKDLDSSVVTGRVNSGRIQECDFLTISPNGSYVKVQALYCDDEKVRQAKPGDNLTIHLAGRTGDVTSGSLLLCTMRSCPAVTRFFASVKFFKEPHCGIFFPGYKASLHIHEAIEDCEIIDIRVLEDGVVIEQEIMSVKNREEALCLIEVSKSICMESSSRFPRLGKFVLRCGGHTIASGDVIEPLLSV
ncbi:eukaryotic peptide chain release factor GTP-binding subunit ERF3A isoform X2 [Eutrema salsugineum]|nr:eukaryotic peptide chain release factor GTP-binding subunit ERF3A isoform X2 [Eutrema salsugineum]XP_024014587.1 eukaryotic peptide chain release factor GTP-binding subunit ERF3A isoform X2 [Eutrema salsugineum]